VRIDAREDTGIVEFANEASSRITLRKNSVYFLLRLRRVQRNGDMPGRPDPEISQNPLGTVLPEDCNA
jgi:hypothetical protein